MKAVFSYGHRHQFRYAGNTTLEARADPASGAEDSPRAQFSLGGSLPSDAPLRGQGMVLAQRSVSHSTSFVNGGTSATRRRRSQVCLQGVSRERTPTGHLWAI